MQSRPSLRRTAIALGAGLLLALGSACVHPQPGPAPPGHAKVKRAGPPPWAPAHGYRHKHASGVELVFDAGMGVYAVLGHPGHFFHDGRFFKRRGRSWAWARSWHGPWTLAHELEVPAGLLRPNALLPARQAPPGRGRGAGR